MTKPAFRSRHCWVLAAAIAIAPLLPGCTPAAPDISLFNRIAVKPVQLTHTVHFAPGSAVLTPSEADSLRTFLGEGRRDNVDGITVIAGDSPIADQRRARVDQALDTLGFTHRVAPPDANLTADAVLVTVNRLAAVPPSCPNWTAVGSYDPSNGSMSNLGCATSADLYLMVADPRDLVAGHAESSTDAAPSMRAVEAYRTGDQKANPQAPSLGDQGASGGSGGTSTTSGGGNGQ